MLLGTIGKPESESLKSSECQKYCYLNVRCLPGKDPPVVTAATQAFNISEQEITPAPQVQSHFSQWLTVGVLFGILLLVAVISIAVGALHCNYTKLR